MIFTAAGLCALLFGAASASEGPGGYCNRGPSCVVAPDGSHVLGDVSCNASPSSCALAGCGGTWCTNDSARVLYCGVPGKCNRKGGDAVAASATLRAAGVRCCTENSGLGWPRKCRTIPGVFGESNLPACFRDKTFDEAVGVCDSAGGRLCSGAELMDRCTRGTGCNLNSKLVWGCAANGKGCAVNAECCGGFCDGGVCEDPVGAPTDTPTSKPTSVPTNPLTVPPPTPPAILLETFDFENDTVPLDITGGAVHPWEYDDRSGVSCSGSLALTAGLRGGVDDESVLSITAPPGTTSLTYFYSYPSQLDPQDDFHVLVNDVLVNFYEFGPGENCTSASIPLSGGDVVKFRCASTRRNEICTIDNLQFFGSAPPTTTTSTTTAASTTTTTSTTTAAPPTTTTSTTTAASTTTTTSATTAAPPTTTTSATTAASTTTTTSTTTAAPPTTTTSATTAASTTTTTSTTTCQPSNAGVNLCLAIDMSGSVCSPDFDAAINCLDCPEFCNSGGLLQNTCCPNFLDLLQFSGDVINGVGADAAPSSTFSAITFSTNANVVTPPVADAAAAAAAVLNATYAGGLTNHVSAIQACRSLFADAGGNDPVILLVTDGVATFPVDTDPRDAAIAAATDAKNAGVYIVPVFVNPNQEPIFVDYLKLLSSDGVVTPSTSFGGLSALVEGVVEDVRCAFDAPTTTTAATTTAAPPTILLETFDFEDDTVALDITGGASQPWDYDDMDPCSGSMVLTAGRGRSGVDTESVLSITAPPGTTSLTYFYSYPSVLDPADDFHVLVNDVRLNSYEEGPGETCASASITLSGGDVVKFRCASDGRNEGCTIDNLQFFGSLGA